MEEKYFIDISNVDSDTDTALMLQRLFLLGCKPVYNTFREVNLATGITSATWRVYFLSSSCPSALIVNGSVCDQVLFQNKLHPAHGKNAPFQSERLPFGFRSHHGIDLGTTDGVFPPSAPVPEPAQHQHQHQPRPRTYAQAVSGPPRPTTVPQQTSLQRAVAEAKKRDGQLQPGAQHGHLSITTQLPTISGHASRALSISTLSRSTGKINPPGSPSDANNPPLLLTNGSSDGFVAPPNRKKRGRNAIDFSNMLVKQSAKPLDGIATSNYFLALQTMEAKFDLRDVTTDKKFGVCQQVLPVDVKRPDVMKT